MIEFQDWGLIEYSQALIKQEQLVEKIAAEKSDGYLIFCSHPPVVTLGRKTQEGDLYDWHGSTIQVSRGGRATYHGPSQLVIYPILNLEYSAIDGGSRRPFHDVGWVLRTTELAIINVLKEFGIREASGKSIQLKSNLDQPIEETGVWIKNKKIASLGIAVKQWVCFHGAAINLDFDSKAFWGMNPCGFQNNVMISLEEVLQKKVSRTEFSEKLKAQLLELLV